MGQRVSNVESILHTVRTLDGGTPCYLLPSEKTELSVFPSFLWSYFVLRHTEAVGQICRKLYECDLHLTGQ